MQVEFQNKKIRKSGFALAEALVAMGILISGIIGLTGLVNSGLSTSRIIGQHFTASYLATEGVEVVKNLIDANVMRGNPWTQNVVFGGPFKALDFATILESGCTPPNPWPYGVCNHSGGNNLYLDPSNHLYYYFPAGGSTPPAHIFNRRIRVNEVVAGRELLVESRVRWADRKGVVYTVEAQDHFFNWRP